MLKALLLSTALIATFAAVEAPSPHAPRNASARPQAPTYRLTSGAAVQPGSRSPVIRL